MTSTRIRPRWLLALLVATTLSVSACGGGGGGDGSATTEPRTDEEGGGLVDAEPVEGGTIVWALEGETDGLNPVSGRFVNSGHVMASAIFDPLTTLDAEGRWEPYLAESLEPNDDYTEWTITLRDGVTFHDGTPLTAEALNTVLNLHLDSAISKGALFDVDSFEVSGPLSVRARLKVSWPTFPYLFTTQIGYVPSPEMLDVPEEARTPVGTGPFKFQEWNFGTSFKAVKYPDYWRRDDQGRQLPYLDAIEFRPIPDPQLRTDSLLDADVDMIITAALSEIARLEASPDVKMLTYSEGEEQYVTLQTAKPPFNNETARRAVALATDQAAVREQMGADYAVPANSQWAPGQPGYREDSGQVQTDLEAAKRAVADYTAETGQPLAFTLISSQVLENQKLQQILKQQWEAAGMQVSLETVPQADLVVRYALGNYQAGISRLFGFPEPDTDHFFMHSRSIDPNLISFNLPRYANPEIDAALDRARSSTDEATRDEAYATVARLMNEHVPVVWLYRPTWAIASNLQVHGYRAAANGTIQTIGPKTWVATLFKTT